MLFPVFWFLSTAFLLLIHSLYIAYTQAVSILRKITFDFLTSVPRGTKRLSI
jgi:hypothetical protein